MHSVTSSYLVLFGATLVFFLELGTLKSLSVLLPDLQEQFSTYTWIIGLAIALVRELAVSSVSILYYRPVFTKELVQD